MTTSLPLVRKKIWAFYKKHKRNFSWRETKDPYKIWISEVMLQQTQTSRVENFYKNFLSEFPTLLSLSKATTTHLLTTWKGLGYNRRALALREGAKVIIKSFKGILPRDPEQLQTIPGIGPYTAQAIRAFAFNISAHPLETNIRTVLIQEFFKNTRKKVTDASLLEILQSLSPTTKVRDWYYAMMDYGSWLKSQGVATHRKSASYKKQSRFKGSQRELRGLTIGILLKEKSITTSQLASLSNRDWESTERVLSQLHKEGVLKKIRGQYRIN